VTEKNHTQQHASSQLTFLVIFSVTAEEATAKKKRKKKKNPVPKNFQPNFTPDPERWLPLRERYVCVLPGVT